jgi:hypothetical protein
MKPNMLPFILYQTQKKKKLLRILFIAQLKRL